MLETNAHAQQPVSEVMERLRPFVARRLSSAADVDDVLQDVFLRMQRHVHELRDSERFGPWIYRIVRNVIADRFRAQQRQAALPEEAWAVHDDGSANDGVQTELAACVAPLVAQLPSPYREAVTLIDLEGVSFKAASSMTGLSVPALKSRVQRGRAKLRESFTECCRMEFDVRRRVVDYECVTPDAKCGCRE